MFPSRRGQTARNGLACLALEVHIEEVRRGGIIMPDLFPGLSGLANSRDDLSWKLILQICETRRTYEVSMDSDPWSWAAYPVSCM